MRTGPTGSGGTPRGSRVTSAQSARLADAGGHYRDALALAEELEKRPVAAHCHLGLGKLYRRRGKREQAREHQTTATTLLLSRRSESTVSRRRPANEVREVGATLVSSRFGIHREPRNQDGISRAALSRLSGEVGRCLPG